MGKTYKEGSIVSWKWGRGIIKGVIEEVYYNPIEKEIRTVKVKRNGSIENPAYLIRKLTKGTKVLKLHSELLGKIMSQKTPNNENHFIPPEEVSKAAEMGLFLKEKFNRGGTKVGWARAKELKERLPVNITEIKKISSYFARHEIDKKAQNFGNHTNPSKGYIAWLLWGGEPGKKWVEEIKKQFFKDNIN